MLNMSAAVLPEYARYEQVSGSVPQSWPRLAVVGSLPRAAHTQKDLLTHSSSTRQRELIDTSHVRVLLTKPSRLYLSILNPLRKQGANAAWQFYARDHRADLKAE